MTRRLASPPAFAWLTLIAAIAGGVVLIAAAGATWYLFQRDAHRHTRAESDDGQWYISGMHPWIIQPEPGFCPICHMELVPLDPAQFTGEIAIDPVVVQNIGMRVTEATLGPLVQRVRTVGQVEYDQTRLRDVNTKLGGWVETLHVNSVGRDVQPGEPLLELYSRELFAAQEEYLLALRGVQALDASAASVVREQAQALLDAAATRLRFFDVSEEQIQALAERKQPTRTMTISSPHAGVVIEKDVYEGMRIEPGMRLYRIADLSSVWVITSVHEQQLPLVREGQSAVLELPYWPGVRIEGTVDYIYPFLNEQTREARIRLVFDNRDGRLKPGMFAQVELDATREEEVTLVPRAAVIHTGDRQVLFVAQGEGRFEPRDVTLGQSSADGWVEILAGVEPGERVVTSGQFLLDSESRTREALAKLMPVHPAAAPAGEAEPVAPLVELTPSAQTQLDELVAAYLQITDALMRDELPTAHAQMQRIKAAAEALANADERRVAELAHHIAAHAPAADADVEAFRQAFRHVSEAVIDLVKVAPPTDAVGSTVYEAYCPMEKASWLQASQAVANPYAPQTMPRCGSIQNAIPARPATDTPPAENPAS